MSDERWFTELVDGAQGQTFKVERVLAKEQTAYQSLEIFENPTLGRVFLLDDVMMLTERDEANYHEMLVHPGLLAHPCPERVLVLGGGDGGTLREIVKHPSVKQAILCEIDERVVELSKEHLPFTASGFEHDAVEVVIGDGVAYIADHVDSFDAIIIDSTDPVGFAEGLFRAPFYRHVQRALRPGGMLLQQTESPFFNAEVWARIFRELKQVFDKTTCYSATIPMYPSGFWTFAMATAEGPDAADLKRFDESRAAALSDLRYYSADIQRACTALPAFAARILKEALA